MSVLLALGISCRCLVVVRLCESVGGEFLSACGEKLALLGVLFPLLSNTLRQYLGLLPAVSVVAGPATRLTDVLATVACTCQALSAILILPLYPNLLSGKKESGAVLQCHFASVCSRRSKDVDRHGPSEEEHLPSDDSGHVQQRRLGSPPRRPTSASLSRGSAATGRTASEHRRGRLDEKRMEKDCGPADRSAARKQALCERDGCGWQIPLLGSQLFNSTPILSTLR